MYNADYSDYDPLTRKLIVYEMEMEELEKERARDDEDDSDRESRLRWLRSKIDQIDNLWPR